MDVPNLNLNDYLDIIYRRRFTAIVVCVVTVICWVFFLKMQAPTYKARLMFKVDSAYSAIIPSQVYQEQPTGRVATTVEELYDYAKLISSRSNIEKTLVDLGLVTSRDISKIEDYMKNISTTVVPKSNLIELEVTDTDPVMTARIANKMFEVFKEINFNEKNFQKRNVAVFIKKSLEEVSEKLKKEEGRMRQLTSSGVIGTAETLRKQIDQLDQKRVDLLNIYTEKHPDVLALRQQIEEMKQELQKLPVEEFEYSTLLRDITLDQQIYNDLKQKLQEAQIKEAEVIDNISLVEDAIPPQKKSFPTLIHYLLGILYGALAGITVPLFIEHVVETSFNSVEDIENLLKIKVVGIIPCASKSAVKEGVWRQRIFKVKRSTAGINPKGLLMAFYSVDPLFEEAFRILGTNIQAILGGPSGRIKNKTLLITSAVPQEGKSMISSNLATLMAQMGYKTLLIDSDSRRPSVHQLFGFPEKSKGFVDIIAGKTDLKEAEQSVIKNITDIMLSDQEQNAEEMFKKSWLNNLHIMTAGSIAPTGMHMFGAERIKEIIEYFKAKYDIVIIDTCPILSVSDTSVLLPMVDDVMIVYKVGFTSRLTLKRVKSNIENIRGKGTVNGLILNNVISKLTMAPYYSYGGKYYANAAKPASGANRKTA
ncbi:MAG: AAA family ATPase [Candidatus Omnitrophica bacterium]|nr:AAA family ATPase [Candidatus Omnitrophota bacterium]